MNWHLIALLGLALFIILIIATTFILYIRHWDKRQTALQPNNPYVEGKYFKRYIPDILQTKIQQQQLTQQKQRTQSHRSLYIGLVIIILSLLIAAIGSLLYFNKDRFNQTIYLTQHERNALIVKDHQWEKVDDQVLPNLGNAITPWQKTGFVLVGDKTSWAYQGRQIAKVAHYQWQVFAAEHSIKVADCTWDNLKECQESYKDWLFVVLPSQWNEKALDELLAKDSNVLLYTAPKQLYNNKKGQYQWRDLSFSKSVQPQKPFLSLVADQVLTLNFDAGLVLDVLPAFQHYYATHTQPQAISINTNRVAGGTNHTRLYANTSPNKGRVVWMDFSPNAIDHADELNQRHFQGLLASIFRYFKREPYGAWAMWSEGKPFAALLEEDTEDEFKNARDVALFFQQHHYPITWYVLSNDAQHHRDTTKLLAETGEIACHGDHHQPFTLNSSKLQHQRLATCRKVMKALTGQTVRTFRPPEEKYNSATLSAILNNHLTHFIADNSSDRFTPQFYQTKQTQQRLLSLPRMNSDDFNLWHDYELDGRASIELLNDEITWIQGIGGLFVFSFHTQFMDKPENFETIKQIAHRVYNDHAFFATASDIADWWQLRYQLTHNQAVDPKLLQRFKPTYLTVDKDGSLQRKTVTSSDQMSTVRTL